MKIRKRDPLKHRFDVPTYRMLQLSCIETGAQADLYASQSSDLLKANVRLYLGVDEHGVLVAGAFTRRNAVGKSELCGVVVHPEHRNRRYGTELVQYIVGSESAAGVERIELVVRLYSDGRLNDKAARLYRSVGFIETGEIRVGELSDDPRLAYLASTVEADGKYRSAVFELIIEKESEVAHG